VAERIAKQAARSGFRGSAKQKAAGEGGFVISF